MWAAVCVAGIAGGTLSLLHTVRGRRKRLLVVGLSAVLSSGVVYFSRRDPGTLTPAPLRLLAPGPEAADLDRPPEVVAEKPLGQDRVVLTSRGLTRVSPGGKMAWSVRFTYPVGAAGGGLLKLPDGDLLAFLYCQIADTGVQLVRLDPEDGRPVWQAYCRRLGVPLHSKYLHDAEVEIDDEFVKVTSRGAAGTFVELLDPGSGMQLGRGQRMRH
jgi:hypothetical protein